VLRRDVERDILAWCRVWRRVWHRWLSRVTIKTVGSSHLVLKTSRGMDEPLTPRGPLVWRPSPPPVVASSPSSSCTWTLVWSSSSRSSPPWASCASSGTSAWTPRPRRDAT